MFLGLLRIKKMFPGQPAAASGKLQIGDIVLEVNGNDMYDVTHQEAINLIRMGPPEVKLLVKRDPSSIPPSLLQRSGSNASDVDPAQILADIQSKLKTDSPALSKKSSDSSTREQSLVKSVSVDRGDETPKSQQVAVAEAHVSLRSSLISDVSTNYPRISQSSHPSLESRLSEPVTQVRKEHEPLAATNSLPYAISKPKDTPKVNRQEAIQQASEEDEDTDIPAIGDAPLAEDESSDVEDSRRSSSIDIVPHDHSIYDEASIKDLMGKLSTMESPEEREDRVGIEESFHVPLASNELALPVLEDEVSPSPPSSESEESDLEEISMNDKQDKVSVVTPSMENDDNSATMTPQEEVSLI